MNSGADEPQVNGADGYNPLILGDILGQDEGNVAVEMKNLALFPFVSTIYDRDGITDFDIIARLVQRDGGVCILAGGHFLRPQGSHSSQLINHLQ